MMNWMKTGAVAYDSINLDVHGGARGTSGRHKSSTYEDQDAFLRYQLPELSTPSEEEFAWVSWFRSLEASDQRLVKHCAANGIAVCANNFRSMSKLATRPGVRNLFTAEMSLA